MAPQTDPPSLGLGSTLQLHATLPVDSLIAVIPPCPHMGSSPPARPTYTDPPATTGAARNSPRTCWRHTRLPSRSRSAKTYDASLWRPTITKPASGSIVGVILALPPIANFQSMCPSDDRKS